MRCFPIIGIAISTHPQSGWLTDWDMLCDSSGNAVLVIADGRSGWDMDMFAYRVAPDGSMLWGPDGVTLISDDDFDGQPAVTELSSGDFLFAWYHQLQSTGDGDILVQRVMPSGNQLYGAGGVPASASTNERPGYPDVVATPGDGFILSWVRDISSTAIAHVYAQKFDGLANPQWGSYPTVVYDLAGLPSMAWPRMEADGSGGALITWYASESGTNVSRFQHLDATGTELFGTDGMPISIEAGRQMVDPSMAHNTATGDTYFFYTEKDGGGANVGLTAQRISRTGQRLWGAAGLEVAPVGGNMEYQPRAILTQDGVAAVFMDIVTLFHVEVGVVRLLEDGSSPWGGIVTASDVAADKSEIRGVMGADDMLRVAWTDRRSDMGDIYAQNVQADGTLGDGSCAGGTSNYCTGAANSAGAGATIGSSGTTSVAAEDFVLTVAGTPAQQWGVFYYGGASANQAFGNGFRCVGSGGAGLFRFHPIQTNGIGDAAFPLDFSSPPAGSGAGQLLPGARWYFQFWYRDAIAGGAGYNLSDGLQVDFCP